MPKYTVTIEGNGIRKIVEVDTEGMNATVVESASTTAIQPAASSQGGKRSAPSFRLKKRRVTRKLRKTR
jgi:hypothetical protein